MGLGKPAGPAPRFGESGSRLTGPPPRPTGPPPRVAGPPPGPATPSRRIRTPSPGLESISNADVSSVAFGGAARPGETAVAPPTTPKKRRIGAFETEGDSGDEANEIVEVQVPCDNCIRIFGKLARLE